MVNSIKFDGKFGYINDTKHLQSLLVGKLFTFSPDKINVIYAPNGAGKTTILRGIAGNAMTMDGYTKIAKPTDLGYKLFDKETEEDYNNGVIKYIDSLKGNSCDMDWDGSPVYYHNFNRTENAGGSEIGGMLGSIFNSVGEEIQYRMGKSKISDGEKTRWLFNRVIDIIANSKDSTMKFIIEKQMHKKCNDAWMMTEKACRDYFAKFPNYDKVSGMTILLDEVDKSLDLETIENLYMNVLPKLKLDYPYAQIILVTHTPLVLSNKIYDSEDYNIISLDESYTEDARNVIKRMFGSLHYSK